MRKKSIITIDNIDDLINDIGVGLIKNKHEYCYFNTPYGKYGVVNGKVVKSKKALNWLIKKLSIN